MARNQGPQAIGSAPPQLSWTVVRGDTAAFKVYVTDDLKVPLNLDDWQISMQIKRPASVTEQTIGVITDNATDILTLSPAQDPDDAAGEFTVSITATESGSLETGDIFDIELSTAQNQNVWTVAQGYVIVIEDVTN